MSVLSELDHAFDSFRSTAFRLETLAEYWADEERDDFHLFLAGEPLPERSPATDPWLARVARTTAAGKQWRRVRVVSRPLNDYLRFEFDAYPDNAKAGEEVLVADRDEHPRLAEFDQDFWLFDAGEPGEFGLLMDFDQDGRLIGLRRVTSEADLGALCRGRDVALACSMPLQQFLTTTEV